MSRTKRKDYYSDEKVNDQKPWYKPDSKFKKILKKSRKAKERQALRQDKEIIPEFPKTDVWDWN